MSTANPFEAPVGDVVGRPDPTELVSERNDPFYVVSTTKFLVLYIGTLGMYQVYWYFRHWQAQKGDGTDVMAIPRAIFAIFFTHELFRSFHLKAMDQGEEYESWDAGSWATGVVGLMIAGRVISRIDARIDGLTVLSLTPFIVLFLQAFLMSRAQGVANVACGDPRGERNHSLTGLNYFWLAIGVLMWAVTGLSFLVVVLDTMGLLPQ